jgi:hypothetical protein
MPRTEDSDSELILTDSEPEESYEGRGRRKAADSDSEWAPDEGARLLPHTHHARAAARGTHTTRARLRGTARAEDKHRIGGFRIPGTVPEAAPGRARARSALSLTDGRTGKHEETRTGDRGARGGRCGRGGQTTFQAVPHSWDGPRGRARPCQGPISPLSDRWAYGQAR